MCPSNPSHLAIAEREAYQRRFEGAWCSVRASEAAAVGWWRVTMLLLARPDWWEGAGDSILQREVVTPFQSITGAGGSLRWFTLFCRWLLRVTCVLRMLPPNLPGNLVHHLVQSCRSQGRGRCSIGGVFAAAVWGW